MSVKRDNICFIHIATIGNYQYVIDEIISYIPRNSFTRIIANIAGDGPVSLPDYVDVIPSRSPLSEFEFSTLDLIIAYCLENRNSNILYLHTKGVSTSKNICIEEWRQYMLYANLKNIALRERILSEYSACGVDLVPEPTLHFSGNFWWATAEHINTLKHPKNVEGYLSERHKCEFWICSNPHGKYISIHNSNINVYERHLIRYPKEKYQAIIN